MSLLPIRVDGAIQCQTALQLEQHALSYVDVTPPVASSEAVSLHSLVELLTAARNDSNRFLTSMIAKYPKAVDRGSRRKKRNEEEEDEMVEEEQDEAPQLDNTTTNVTVPLPTDPSVAVASPSSSSAAAAPETKRPKLDNQ